MSDVENWALRGAVGAVVAGIVGLFARVRSLERRRERADERLHNLEGRDTGAAAIAELRREFQNLQLCLERNFVRREDWVTHTSRVLGALESQGKQLARLEERLAAMTRERNA